MLELEQSGYITRAFSRVPAQRDKPKVATKSLPSWEAISGRNSYIIRACLGVPNNGTKMAQVRLVEKRP